MATLAPPLLPRTPPSKPKRRTRNDPPDPANSANKEQQNEAAHRQVQVLVESLPYIARFSGKTVVIKYGGAAMGEEACQRAFAQDMLLMHHVVIHPVVVHGGGPHINKLLKRLNLESRFVYGVRVTDQDTMEIVKMVLGAVNQEIISLINHHGGRAVGLSGKDGDLILARKRPDAGPAGEDFGQVGEVQEVRTELPELLIRGGFIPVIAPVAAAPTDAPTTSTPTPWPAASPPPYNSQLTTNYHYVLH